MQYTNVDQVLICSECFYIFLSPHIGPEIYFIKKYSITFFEQTSKIKQVLVSHMFSTNVAKIIKTINLKTKIFLRVINKRKLY